jgi:hypothetical protein
MQGFLCGCIHQCVHVNVSLCVLPGIHHLGNRVPPISLLQIHNRLMIFLCLLCVLSHHHLVSIRCPFKSPLCTFVSTLHVYHHSTHVSPLYTRIATIHTNHHYIHVSPLYTCISTSPLYICAYISLSKLTSCSFSASMRLASSSASLSSRSLLAQGSSAISKWGKHSYSYDMSIFYVTRLNRTSRGSSNLSMEGATDVCVCVCVCARARVYPCVHA